MLFDDPDLLRELYCALEGVSLPPDTPVSINTLENVLFLDFNNDISFTIDGKLVIILEHQSTINPNMALRIFFYISRILEKMIDSRTLYSTKIVSIPRPEFYVLYNGKDKFPDSAVYKLSDHFKIPKELGLSKNLNPLLELEVKVLNINEGRNQDIVSRCKKLAEYSAFITKIHHYQKELGDLKEGVKEAIKFCSKHDILKEYLEIHGSEIMNMIMTEWNTEDALEVRFEEGCEKGREEGIEIGEARGEARGVTIGEARGEAKVIGLLKKGHSLEEIEKMLAKEQ